MIIFLVAAFLQFTAGTSWGNFQYTYSSYNQCMYKMLSQILQSRRLLPGRCSVNGESLFSHSSLTILWHQRGHCEHVNHVATQDPICCTRGSCMYGGYFIIGVLQSSWYAQLSLSLPICIVILLGALCVIRAKTEWKEEI